MTFDPKGIVPILWFTLVIPIVIGQRSLIEADPIMTISEVEIILYVSDQQRSREFYSKVLGSDPVLDVPGMTEFRLTKNIRLGLMPEQSIKKILGTATPDPSSGNGIPRCELYLKVRDIEEAFSNAIKAGAIEISAVSMRTWGDRVGYLSDPDGHIIALAETPL